jgi:hypothetical protein
MNLSKVSRRATRLQKRNPFKAHLLESLETRTLFAVTILPGLHNARFTDVDGDQVFIAVSTGTLTIGNFTTAATGLGDQLELIDLTNAAFNNANIAVTVTKAATGDGLVAIGEIDAGTNNLQNVSIRGDLGSLQCGAANPLIPALKTFAARSIGQYGDLSGGTLNWGIDGNVGQITVNQNVSNAFIGIAGNLNSLVISGSLIGGGNINAGAFLVTGNIGSINIKRDVLGGVGNSSGFIQSQGVIGAVNIGGSVIGGTGGNSGYIFSDGNIGPVTIRHNLVGGSSNLSGYIASEDASIVSVTIKGSLIGGTGTDSGKLQADINIGPVVVKQNIIGGEGANSGNVLCGGNLTSLSVGGSIIGGGGNDSGGVVATNNIGNVFVGGDLNGGPSAADGGIIQCSGSMGNITINGSVIGGGNDRAGRIESGDNMGFVKIGRDLQGGIQGETGRIFCGGNLLGASIGGSIVGGNADDAGQIFVAGNSGNIKIARDIVGGDGIGAGRIDIDNNLAGLSVGGSVTGGTDINSGSINYQSCPGNVFIGGDLVGTSDTTGFINGTTNAITINGSLIGGTGNFSGAVNSPGAINSLKIGHDIRGGSISGTTGNVFTSGAIQAQHLGAITIGGSIIAGIDSSTGGGLFDNASISSANAIKSLTVFGGIYGNIAGDGYTPVMITARGQASPTAAVDVAIGSITVFGSVKHALILAGYGTGTTQTDTTFGAQNKNAQIGTVNVSGEWEASSLVAGIVDTNNDGFGNADDAVIGGGASIAKIGSINIGGAVYGSFDNGDHFGFTSRLIGSYKYLGTPVSLVAGAVNDAIELSLLTGDVTIREV